MPNTDTGTDTVDAPEGSEKKSSNSLGIAILVVAIFMASFWFFPWMLALVGGFFALVFGLVAGILGLIVGLLGALFGLLVGLMSLLLFFVPVILAGALAVIIAMAIIKALRG